jgi:hypothetical protein
VCVSKLFLINKYIYINIVQGLTIVDISANSFPQTLDWLHSYLLQVPRNNKHNLLYFLASH